MDERWRGVSEESWKQLAAGWLAEVRTFPDNDHEDAPEPASATHDTDKEDYGDIVVRMNFTADADLQWKFIEIAMGLATTEEELGYIAAGPVEHLLSRHGEVYVERLEKLVSEDSKYARMINGVWQCGMTDEVYQRVEALQSRST